MIQVIRSKLTATYYIVDTDTGCRTYKPESIHSLMTEYEIEGNIIFKYYPSTYDEIIKEFKDIQELKEYYCEYFI